jgi:hypothetical protein
MFEEEGGQYVDAEDYDKLCNVLLGYYDKLMLVSDGIHDMAGDMECVALNGV